MTQIPPHNLDAERAVLGVVLLEGRRGMDLLAGSALETLDFYIEAHRTLHEHMRKLYDADQPIDLITLSESLRVAGELERVGGPAALALLVEHASILSHVDSYISIVVDAGKGRQIIREASAAITAAYDSRPVDEVLGALGSAVDQIARRVLVDEYDPALQWRRVVASWEKGTVKIGLPSVDKLTGGTARGDLLAVAGWTSDGKTAIAVNRAMAMASAGLRVEFLTLEERVEGIVRRLAADLAMVPTYKLRDGTCSPAEFQRAEEAIRKLQEVPLTIRGVRDLRSLDEQAVAGAVSLSRADVVILDHVQKVQVRLQGRGDLHTYALGRFLDRLHAIGLRDGKVVWINCQFSRDFKKRQGPPMLSDIADSATIERASRQVWLLYWPIKHEKKPDKLSPEDYRVYVAKNSEGGTGKVELRYLAQYGRFEDPAETPF